MLLQLIYFIELDMIKLVFHVTYYKNIHKSFIKWPDLAEVVTSEALILVNLHSYNSPRQASRWWGQVPSGN